MRSEHCAQGFAIYEDGCGNHSGAPPMRIDKMGSVPAISWQHSETTLEYSMDILLYKTARLALSKLQYSRPNIQSLFSSRPSPYNIKCTEFNNTIL
ncbi:hypothetical protein TNCV_4953761 [Trichonephila clavipes]|nr:hypothetical protein TNCV_4953761 [Trichonephila clavipes]